MAHKGSGHIMLTKQGGPLKMKQFNASMNRFLKHQMLFNRGFNSANSDLSKEAEALRIKTFGKK